LALAAAVWVYSGCLGYVVADGGPTDLHAAGATYGEGIWRDQFTLIPDAAVFSCILLMWVLIAGAGLMLHNS